MCSVIARAFGRAHESIERCTVRVKQICSLGSIVDLLRASRPTLGVSAHAQKDENRKRRASRGDARDGVLRLDDASTRLPGLARTTDDAFLHSSSREGGWENIFSHFVL